MKTTLLTILIIAASAVIGFSQATVLHIPVSTNAPFLEQSDKFQIGVKINNYGFNYSAALRQKTNTWTFAVQYNSGETNFNPLNLNSFNEKRDEISLLQTKATKMFFAEVGIGQDFEYKKQRLSLFMGIGQQFHNKKTRLFVQLDWRNENRLMDVGVSVRGNYSIIGYQHLLGLTPVIQTKIKLWKIRIVNQFGYSIAIKKQEGHMKPIFTLGLEYVL